MALHYTTADGFNDIVFVVILDTDGYGSVRFYDARYKGEGERGGIGFTVDGQFVSSYYAEEFGDEDVAPYTLDLQTDVPDWKVSPKGTQWIHHWVRAAFRLEGRPVPVHGDPSTLGEIK